MAPSFDLSSMMSSFHTFIKSTPMDDLFLFVVCFILFQKSIQFVWRMFLRPSKTLKKYRTALITGATDGIGLALANKLAEKNLHLILVSRTQEKLDQVAEKIRQKYPKIKVQTLAVDFAHLKDGEIRAIHEIVRTNEVGMLINNVGKSYEHPEWFHHLTADEVNAINDVNINSTVHMTHAVLPGMVARKKGLIVNFSSGAALVPSPLLAQYGAAKAYIDKFTNDLAIEYRQNNIQFQVFNPLFVSTAMAKMRPSLTTPTPRAFAAAAIRAMGYEQQTSPYWAHALMLGLVNVLPRAITSRYIFGLHKSLRIRALKKAERQQKQQ